MSRRFYEVDVVVPSWVVSSSGTQHRIGICRFDFHRFLWHKLYHTYDMISIRIVRRVGLRWVLRRVPRLPWQNDPLDVFGGSRSSLYDVWVTNQDFRCYRLGKPKCVVAEFDVSETVFDVLYKAPWVLYKAPWFVRNKPKKP